MTQVNEYDLFRALKGAMEMHELGRPPCSYGKMVQSGDLYECGDYGAGFLHFKIYPLQDANSNWSIRVAITTIDDGVWGCWVCGLTYVKTAERIQKFTNNYLKHLVVLPPLEQLNKDLQIYGFYIENEG